MNHPTPITETTTHTVGATKLVIQHTFECELEECTEVARHVSKIDGARICDICEEIEYDQLS